MPTTQVIGDIAAVHLLQRIQIQVRRPFPRQKANKQIAHHAVVGKKQLVDRVVFVHGYLVDGYRQAWPGPYPAVCPTTRTILVSQDERWAASLGKWQVGRGAGVNITLCSQPDPLGLKRLLAHTCTPQTAHNPSRKRPGSVRHFNSRHASHGLETGRRQGNAKYVDNQGTNGLTLNTKRQEKHYRLVKMLP